MKKQLLVLIPLLALLALPLGAVAVSDFTLAAIPTVNLHVGSVNSDLNLSNYVTHPVNTTFSFVIAAQGTTTNYSTHLIAGPTNLSVTGNTIGADTVNISVTATNASNSSDTLTKYATVNVNVYNTAPVFVINSQVYARAGTTFLQQVASDADSDTLLITADKGDWTTAISIVGKNVTFMPSGDDIGNMHDVIFNVTDAHGVSIAKTVTFIVTDSTDDGYLIFSDWEINDLDGDDSQWAPGDRVEVNYELENKLSVDISDVKLKAWIEDSSGKRVTDREEATAFDLSDGDTQSDTLTLTIPIDTSKSALYLFVRAEGEDDNNVIRSVLKVEELEIEKSDYDVAFDSVTITPDPAVCGQSLDVIADIWNVGSEDEEVKLHITNSDLGIDVYSDLFELDNSGDNRELVKTVPVSVGTSIEPGNYTLTVTANYNSGKDYKSVDADINVVCSGYVAGTEDENTGSTGAGAFSFASTTITGKQGQQSKITGTLKNTGSTAAVYTFEMSGIQDWATGFVEPDTMTVAAGASTDIFVYLTPKTSASGDKTATVTVKSGGAVLESETLTVELPERPGISITSLGSLPSIDNTAALVIVAGVLIVISLVVLGRKRAAAGGVKTYGKKRGRPSSDEEE